MCVHRDKEQEMKAEQLMTTPVIAVKSSTTVYEIASLLMTHRINSLPVIDDEDHVIGLVTKDDLFLKERHYRLDLKIPTLFKEIVNLPELVEAYKQSGHICAEDVMLRDPVCVDVDDELGAVAWTMIQQHVHMAPVLRNGKLVGVISRRDLLKLHTDAG